MKQYGRIALLGVALSALTVPAQADVMSTAATVVTTESIKSLLGNAIRQAEQSGDYLAFRVGTELRLSIEAWEQSNGRLLDKTFSELSQQQQAFLTGADRIATNLSLEVGKSLDKVEDLSNQWQNLASSTILANSVPLVSSYRPALFRPTDVGSSFRLGIKGANLNREAPSLSVPGGQVSLVGNTSVNLLFALKDLQPAFQDKETTLIETELTLYRPADNFILRLLGKSEPMVFKLPIMVGPTSLGSYELVAIHQESVERTQSKSANYSHSSGDASWNCKGFNQGPSETGRSMRNIALTVTTNGRASKHDLRSQSSQGYSVEICAKRWVDGPSLSKPAGDTGPGWRHVRMDWQEVWTEKVTKTTTSTGNLEWGKDVPLTMPSSTQSFTLKIKSFDGREMVFTGSGRKSLFDVQYNLAGKQVVIGQVDPQLIN